MKKGFTLIEVLAVIIILAILALIAVPAINGVLKNSRQKAYDLQVDTIEEAAMKYSIEHNEILPKDDGIFTNQLMLSQLISSGYIEKTDNGKIYNPIDNSEMNGCVNIKYDLNYNQYTYIYDNECLPQTVINYDNYYINYGGLYIDSFSEGVVTSDGGYIAVGTTNSQNIVGLETSYSNINNDALIVKFDASGNVIWQDTFGGSHADVFLNVIEIEENGQKYYIAVGYAQSIDGDLEELNVDSAYIKSIIIKYDANGKIVDKKIFVDYSYIQSIKKIDNGYIAVGYFNDDYQGEIYENKINDYKGYGDAFIMQLNNNFEVEWSSFFGGSNAEVFIDFIITDFGYVVVGQGRSLNGDMSDIYVDNDAWVYDGIIVSYDKEGNVLNKEAFGSSADDVFNNLIEVSDGYIAVGFAINNDLDLSNTGRSGAIIAKYDKNLNFEKYIVIDNNSSNVLNDIILDNDRIIVVGNVLDNNLYTDGIILEITEDLEIVKEERFKGNNSDAFNAIVKKDNNYIIFGSTYSKGKDVYDTLDPYLKGNQDAILLSYDENFNLTKIFNKMVDTELIPKEVVKNYGTSIPSYENKDSLKLYTTNNPSEDLGNWCDANAIHYGEKDNYTHALCLRPFNSSDIISLYEKTNSQGVSYIKGLNDYKMNLNTDKVDLSNSWFKLHFYYNYPLTDIKLIFNGERCTLEECVELGYIEPLVIYGYNDSVIGCVVDNRDTILNGVLDVSTNGNTNSRIFVFFKTKASGFEGISLNFEGTPGNYASFTLEALRNFEISLSKAE